MVLLVAVASPTATAVIAFSFALTLSFPWKTGDNATGECIESEVVLFTGEGVRGQYDFESDLSLAKPVEDLGLELGEPDTDAASESDGEGDDGHGAISSRFCGGGEGGERDAIYDCSDEAEFELE